MVIDNIKTFPRPSLNYFVGIDVPSHIKEEIYYYFSENIMKEYSNLIELFNKREFHITIGYLGKITEEQRQRLITVSDRIIVPPFKMSIKGISFYPPGKKPKSIWIGIDQGRSSMNVFANNIRKTIANQAGLIAKDDFFPHITIAKVKNFNSDLSKLYKKIESDWDYPFGAFTVESFHLYRITKNGYTYNHEVKLKKLPYLILN